MSDDTVVPFLDAAAKRANDQPVSRHALPVNQDAGNPNIEAIEKILSALEGMQTQIQALIDLAVDMDKRIQRLEGKSRIIKVQS